LLHVAAPYTCTHSGTTPNLGQDPASLHTRPCQCALDSIPNMHLSLSQN
jgi:hypothetical protein